MENKKYNLYESLTEQFIPRKKFEYKISKEDIANSLTAYLEDEDTNISIKPEIVIETAEPSYFACSISSSEISLTTGIGGFKIFLQNIPNLDMFKVSYDNVILNQQEKQDLYAKYR